MAKRNTATVPGLRLLRQDDQDPLFEDNPTTLRTMCQKCGGEGRTRVVERPDLPSRTRRPILPGVSLEDIRKFCTCPPNMGGPYVAPKGYVAKFTIG